MIRSGQRLSVSNRRLLVLVDEFIDARPLDVAHVHGTTPESRGAAKRQSSVSRPVHSPSSSDSQPRRIQSAPDVVSRSPVKQSQGALKHSETRASAYSTRCGTSGIIPLKRMGE